MFRRRIAERESEVDCSQDNEDESRVQFQICSHNTTTQLYEEVQNTNTLDSVIDIVCEALDDLSGECFGYLSECLPGEDLIVMKKLHFEEVISFLVRTVGKKVTKDDISSCDAVNNVIYDEMDTNNDDHNNEEDMKEKNRKSLQKGNKQMYEENERLQNSKFVERKKRKGSGAQTFHLCFGHTKCLLFVVMVVKFLS